MRKKLVFGSLALAFAALAATPLASQAGWLDGIVDAVRRPAQEAIEREVNDAINGSSTTAEPVDAEPASTIAGIEVQEVISVTIDGELVEDYAVRYETVAGTPVPFDGDYVTFRSYLQGSQRSLGLGNAIIMDGSPRPSTSPNAKFGEAAQGVIESLGSDFNLEGATIFGVTLKGDVIVSFEKIESKAFQAEQSAQ